MKFSIIIPVYDAQDTIKYCLDAVFSSENKDFEVIAVTSKSTDASKEIVKEYPCKPINLATKKGAAASRNIGAGHAQGEILVFIDADVVIKKNTLDIIEKSFTEDKDAVAVTGILSKECPHKNFFTQYKNLYMRYIFKRYSRHVDFLYGSIIAVRKKDFLRFNENFRITDDTELGQRFKKLNKKIILNPELEVTHLKRYNLKGIIKNDFLVPFWWVKSFILYHGYNDIFKKKTFAHARISHIVSIATSFLILASLFLWANREAKASFFLFIAAFFLLNYSFFRFLRNERGFLFSVKSAVFSYFDMLIMGLGILTGFIYFTGFTRNK